MAALKSSKTILMKSRSSASAGLLVGIAVLLCVTLPTPGLAEVLVLNDGQVIETQGPWTLDGRRITYTALNGTFSAVRASLVDLEKSRELAEARLNPVSEKAEAKETPEAGLVVRQGDVRTVAHSLVAAENEGQALPPDELGVTEWSEDVAANGTKLVGSLRNGTKNAYIALDLEVTLLAENGDRLATRSAALERPRANPGVALSIEVTFPDVYAYTDVSFEIKGDPYEWREIPTGAASNDDQDREETGSTSSDIASSDTGASEDDPPLD